MGITIEICVGIMGHFFWPVTCAHMGKQLNPQPSHPGKVWISRPPGQTGRTKRVGFPLDYHNVE